MSAWEWAQLGGALLLLAAFAAAQANATDEHAFPYLLANAVGSAALAASAVVVAAWGFVFLEVVWALVSLAALAVRLRGRLG